jgi:2-polyprenyl-6-methoxyphenol hydroxylase-like FAD-dependent oxidoreductase
MAEKFDVAVVGGGIAGASLAYAMCKGGARAVVLEAETEFKDRVRGEVLCPWGTADAQALGIMEALQQADACALPWLNQYMGPQQILRRDFLATTPAKTPMMTFYHPKMQTAVLRAAESAGADVRRGVTVSAVTPGRPARVTYRRNDGAEDLATRMVVIADGRNSQFRKSAGFSVQRETHTLCIAGVLMEGVRRLPEDTFHMFTNTVVGEVVAYAPEGSERARVYLVYWGESRPRLQGAGDVGRLLEALEWTGLAEEYFSGAQQAGPLATFEGADHWVEHPYREGVALLGDAAASSDPAWGQGLSLAVRGVRILRDALLRNQDWDKAGEEYAREQHSVYDKTRTVTGWFREFFLATGQAADAQRQRALPLIAEDPTRVPDLMFGGPDIPVAADARERFFGEDQAAAHAGS